MNGWRAWDKDAEVYDSRSCSWESLPDTLQVVVCYFDNGKVVHTGGSDFDRWFIFVPG